jgi:hypothetical protein
MKMFLTLFASLFVFIAAHSQTWSDDVAAIFYEKCSKCHNPDGVAPFSLVTYSETSPFAAQLADAINNDVMPPWPPNNNFQQYAHDRSLSVTEETTILDWITNGTPEGIPANTPPPPVFPTGALLGAGDLTVQIPTYMSKATATTDDNVCFAVPSGLLVDRKIKSIEIVPGNRAIVHHVLVSIDSLGASVTDTIGGDCGAPSSPSSYLLTGYTPGDTPLQFPSSAPLKMGFSIQANSQVVFSTHYPAGSGGQYDSTKVIFHFYPPGEPGVREVYSDQIVSNWTMVLPPGEITPVTAQYPPSGGLPIDISLISVIPHMHLLGQDIKVFGIDPLLDTLKLIDLPNWDFEWQGFYYYNYLLRAETGTTVYADGNYNNTTIDTVFAGSNTTDEMFLVYMHYMLYQTGDEFFNMDSLMTLASIPELPDESSVFSAYPNPFSGEMNFYSEEVHPGDILTLYIYDNNGKVVRKLIENELISDDQFLLKWDGNNSEGKSVSNGMYHVSVNLNGVFTHQRIVKQR